MCRLAAYLGPPTTIATLTHDPPHSLLVQSYKPRELREALLNGDGVGAAWYPDDGNDSPVCYRSASPIWSDENFAALAPRIRSRLILAAVRSATPGLEVSRANTQPFEHQRWAFLHNGYLQDFRASFMRPLRERLNDDAYARVIGGTDSEHVFALWTQELDELHGERPADAAGNLVEATRRVLKVCADIAHARGKRALFGLVVSDGETLVGARWAIGGPAPTLYFAESPAACPESVLLSSEPLMEDSAWLPVPEGMLIVASGGTRASIEPIV